MQAICDAILCFIYIVVATPEKTSDSYTFGQLKYFQTCLLELEIDEKYFIVADNVTFYLTQILFLLPK